VALPLPIPIPTFDGPVLELRITRSGETSRMGLSNLSSMHVENNADAVND